MLLLKIGVLLGAFLGQDTPLLYLLKVVAAKLSPLRSSFPASQYVPWAAALYLRTKKEVIRYYIFISSFGKDSAIKSANALLTTYIQNSSRKIVNARYKVRWLRSPPLIFSLFDDWCACWFISSKIRRDIISLILRDIFELVDSAMLYYIFSASGTPAL